MIETFKKIWQFAGDEKKNINQSVWISFLSAILQMFQVGAIYLVIRALTEGAQGGRTAGPSPPAFPRCIRPTQATSWRRTGASPSLTG